MNRFFFACTLGACALSLLLPSVAHAATGVTISVADARLVEPPSGQKSMIFPVTMSNIWPEDVRFSYATSTGPNTGSADASTLAQSGFDFSSRVGQLTIPAGSRTAQIEVPILADTEIEKDETFQVTLSNVQGFDNNGLSVSLLRSVAKGTIVEGVKGVSLGGKITSYVVSPGSSSSFNAVAQPVAQTGVSVLISGSNIARTVTTDAAGNYTLLVRPGTYTVQVSKYTRQDINGDPQLYSLPARTVTVTGNSLANSFAFYGVAGTVAVPYSENSTFLIGAVVRVEARLTGSSSSSPAVATAIANYYDSTGGYRFFIPALPAGQYTLSVKDLPDYYPYSSYYDFPTLTVTLPAARGVNRPDARIAIVGTIKTSASTQSVRKSASAPNS